MASQPSDAVVTNHGSICLMYPATDAARSWLGENIAEDAQWWGHSLAIEPRYVEDIAEGMRDAGLVVS